MEGETDGRREGGTEGEGGGATEGGTKEGGEGGGKVDPSSETNFQDFSRPLKVSFQDP